MGMDRNPYATPGGPAGAHMLRTVPIESVPTEPAMGMIDIVEQAARPPRAWRLAFGEEAAWLYLPTERTAFELGHAALAEHGTIMPWSRFVALVLRGLLPDGHALAFKVEGDRIAPFRRWVLLRRELVIGAAPKKGARFSLAIGVFIAVTGLPGIAEHFDPFMFAFGAGFALLAIVGPRRPRAWLFAVEALVWLSFTASSVVNAIDGSKLSVVFAIVGLLIGRQSLLKFRFYR
jgi:hypothetical protein